MKLIVLIPITARSGSEFSKLLDDHDQMAQLPGFFYIDEFLTEVRNVKDLNLIAHIFINSYEEYFRL